MAASIEMEHMVRIFISTFVTYWLVCQVNINPLYAETLYIKSSNTNVYEKDSSESKVIQTLKAGVEVQVLQESQNFTKVTLLSGKVGWVLKYKLINSYSGNPNSVSKSKLILPFDDVQDFALRESDSGSSIRARDRKPTESIDLDDHQNLEEHKKLNENKVSKP